MEEGLLFFDSVVLISLNLLFVVIWWVMVFYTSKISVQAEAVPPVLPFPWVLLLVLAGRLGMGFVRKGARSVCSIGQWWLSGCT